jgi:hypothetical protein
MAAMISCACTALFDCLEKAARALIHLAVQSMCRPQESDSNSIYFHPL